MGATEVKNLKIRFLGFQTLFPERNLSSQILKVFFLRLGCFE